MARDKNNNETYMLSFPGKNMGYDRSIKILFYANRLMHKMILCKPEERLISPRTQGWVLKFFEETSWCIWVICQY